MSSLVWYLVGQISLIFTVGVASQYNCNVLLPEANVYCTSLHQFNLEPPSCLATKFSCPVGYVCSDTNTICSLDGPAACKLSKACNTCQPDIAATCVNKHQYVNCVDGRLDAFVRNCPASRPYCSMEYSIDNIIKTVCTNLVQHVACDECSSTEIPPTITPPTETLPTQPSTEETTTTETTPTENSSTEAPSTEAPSTESPSTEPPSTETPSTETPSTEEPSTESPVTETPPTETPSTESPSTESPSTETQSTLTPSTESPATETPPTEKPTTETSSTAVPSSTATAPTATTSTTTETVPTKDVCFAYGKFKVSDDITCKRYYYCYANEKGELEKLEFVCPYRTLYNPLKTKCVTETGNFKCEN